MSVSGYHKLTFLNTLLAAIVAVFTLASCAKADGSHGGPRIAPPQALCGDRATADRVLKNHDERRIGYGISGGRIAELYVNLETGTWTFVVHINDKVTCFHYAGDGWRPSLGETL